MEEGDVAVEGVGVVGLCGGPEEEARGGEVVGEGADGVGDEGGGECDEVQCLNMVVDIVGSCSSWSSSC